MSPCYYPFKTYHPSHLEYISMCHSFYICLIYVFYDLFPVKVMVTNVTSLLKTVKTVEDEAVRGTRALESTIEAIGQEVKVRPPIINHM